jgi:uncharacterized Zn finger protein
MLDITCDTCGGMKFVLSNNEKGYRDLQRCDDCGGFESDLDAKKYVLTYIENTEKHWSHSDHYENKNKVGA